MHAEELVRVCEANIRALQRHVRDQSMDDTEEFRVIRVLIETAETLLAEIGQSEGKIQTAVWNLMELAKNLYIGFCLEQDPEIANQEDFAEEFGEFFECVFFHGISLE